jgi:lipoprotein-anchoring transpeptidase ErfK/SrfK
MRLKTQLFTLPLALLMGACSSGGDTARDVDRAAAEAQSNGADSMASRDPAPGTVAEVTVPDSEERPVMRTQVVLERLGFGPGVIDGKPGASLTNALRGFQESRDLPVTGTLDTATRQALGQWINIPATRVVTIPEDWGDIAFTPLPEDPAAQAKLGELGYESMTEKLAERFHTTPEVLAALNPGGRPAGAGNAQPAPAAPGTVPAFRPGQEVRVPNIGADRIDAGKVDNPKWLATLRALGVGTDQPRVKRIVVDESEGWLKGYDADGRLAVMFTVTTGSRHDPLPIGDWEVKGVAYNPPYAFDPALLRGVPQSAGKHRLPPGPNSPVGVVWIDLSKEHYGIHGTPAPDTIGTAQSNGCVRLTNWDAARLAAMVAPGTKVEFRP